MQGILAGRQKKARNKAQEKILRTRQKKREKHDDPVPCCFRHPKRFKNAVSLPSAPRKKELSSQWWDDKKLTADPTKKHFTKTHILSTPFTPGDLRLAQCHLYSGDGISHRVCLYFFCFMNSMG